MQTGNRTSSLHAKQSHFSGLLRHDTNANTKVKQTKNSKRRAIHLAKRKLLPENEHIFNISKRLLKSGRILVEPFQRETCLKYCSKVLRSLLSRVSALTIDF